MKKWTISLTDGEPDTRVAEEITVEDGILRGYNYEKNNIVYVWVYNAETWTKCVIDNGDNTIKFKD